MPYVLTSVHLRPTGARYYKVHDLPLCRTEERLRGAEGLAGSVLSFMTLLDELGWSEITAPLLPGLLKGVGGKWLIFPVQRCGI